MAQPAGWYPEGWPGQPGWTSATPSTPPPPTRAMPPPAYAPWPVPPTVAPGPLRHTSGLAVASLAVAIGGLFVFVVPALAGVVLGLVALPPIQRSGGTLQGESLALAGIIIGLVPLVILLAVLSVTTAWS